MGNFDDRDSLNLKSDKERVLSSLISRIKHQPKTSLLKALNSGPLSVVIK